MTKEIITINDCYLVESYQKRALQHAVNSFNRYPFNPTNHTFEIGGQQDKPASMTIILVDYILTSGLQTKYGSYHFEQNLDKLYKLTSEGYISEILLVDAFIKLLEMIEKHQSSIQELVKYDRTIEESSYQLGGITMVLYNNYFDFFYNGQKLSFSKLQKHFLMLFFIRKNKLVNSNKNQVIVLNQDLSNEFNHKRYKVVYDCVRGLNIKFKQLGMPHTITNYFSHGYFLNW